MYAASTGSTSGHGDTARCGDAACHGRTTRCGDAAGHGHAAGGGCAAGGSDAAVRRILRTTSTLSHGPILAEARGLFVKIHVAICIEM